MCAVSSSTGWTCPHPVSNRRNPGQNGIRLSSESVKDGLLRAVPRHGCNWVLTHWGEFPCSIHIGALVPRRSITAGVPGPRRNADDRDAGWFAPVATRRRPYSPPFRRLRLGSRCFPGGTTPRTPRVARSPWVVLGVGLVLSWPWLAGWASLDGLGSVV